MEKVFLERSSIPTNFFGIQSFTITLLPKIVVISFIFNMTAKVLVIDNTGIMKKFKKSLLNRKPYGNFVTTTHLELPHANSQIRLIELVRYIPSQWTKISSFLN